MSNYDQIRQQRIAGYEAAMQLMTTSVAKDAKATATILHEISSDRATLVTTVMILTGMMTTAIDVMSKSTEKSMEEVWQVMALKIEEARPQDWLS